MYIFPAKAKKSAPMKTPLSHIVWVLLKHWKTKDDLGEVKNLKPTGKTD